LDEGNQQTSQVNECGFLLFVGLDIKSLPTRLNFRRIQGFYRALISQVTYFRVRIYFGDFTSAVE